MWSCLADALTAWSGAGFPQFASLCRQHGHKFLAPFLAAVSSFGDDTPASTTRKLTSSAVGGGVAKWMEKNFGVMLSVNGGMLWLTFFIFRVIMFPYILFMLFKDFYEISQNDPRYAQVWTFEMVYHPCTILFLWVISMMWFQKIHAGFMKVLTGESTWDHPCDEFYRT